MNAPPTTPTRRPPVLNQAPPIVRYGYVPYSQAIETHASNLRNQINYNKPVLTPPRKKAKSQRKSKSRKARKSRKSRKSSRR
jgi:hypothetical protein